MKLVMLLAFIGIVGALASAGVMMIRRRGTSSETNDMRATNPDNRMARALAWRVGISVGLFVCILIAWALGWIQPTGVPLK